MAKKSKRGRKPGVKIGPYNKIKTIKEITQEIKQLNARVAKLEKVLN